MKIYQPIPVAFNIMAKPISAVCNLDCSYCYYLEKQYMYQEEEQKFRMNEQVLEKYIDEYIKWQNVPIVQFVWHGGEPTLLGIDYYRKILELQKKYSRGRNVENVIQTNGTLIDDDWCRFLKENDFLVGISIDGPEHIHDRYRLNKTGAPTFRKVMKGIELLIKHNVRFNTMSVINDHNVKYPLEIYHFLKNVGSYYMQFTPIVERIATNIDENSMNLLAGDDKKENILAPWSVNAIEYGQFLSQIFDDWVTNDVGKYFVLTFDSILANWTGEMPSICVHAETCGHAGAIEHNGDLFACDHYVFPQYKLGNINTDSLVTMMFSQRQTKFGKAKRDALPLFCRECEYLFACNGECPKNRIIQTPTGESGLNYLCSGFRLFFAHVAPYMDFMAEELANKRTPANVMKWAKERKIIKNEPQTIKISTPKQAKRANTKPNDNCPCGSVKKYKMCCRNK